MGSSHGLISDPILYLLGTNSGKLQKKKPVTFYFNPAPPQYETGGLPTWL
jgi:hypothetical protein